jgi:hypothetical protein
MLVTFTISTFLLLIYSNEKKKMSQQSGSRLAGKVAIVTGM